MQIKTMYFQTLQINLFKPLVFPAPFLPHYHHLKKKKNFSLWHHFVTSIASKLGLYYFEKQKSILPRLIFLLSTAFATKN